MGQFITITERSDFLRVQHRGSKAVSKAFVLQGIQRSDAKKQADIHDHISEWRVGFTASKRVGNAVCRNRAKRRLRAVVMSVMPDMARSDVDYVLIARMPLTDKYFKLEANALQIALGELHKKLDRSQQARRSSAKQQSAPANHSAPFEKSKLASSQESL